MTFCPTVTLATACPVEVPTTSSTRTFPSKIRSPYLRLHPRCRLSHLFLLPSLLCQSRQHPTSRAHWSPQTPRWRQTAQGALSRNPRTYRRDSESSTNEQTLTSLLNLCFVKVYRKRKINHQRRSLKVPLLPQSSVSHQLAFSLPGRRSSGRAVLLASASFQSSVDEQTADIRLTSGFSVARDLGFGLIITCGVPYGVIEACTALLYWFLETCGVMLGS